MNSSSGYLPLPLNQYVGVKFRPTDQQLLHYLYCKINSQLYFQGVIFDFDLYGGTEPWEIWQTFKGIDGEDLYFFTKLKRSTTNSGHLSAHINRKIGFANGTWSGENSATPIFANEDDEQVIGYRKRFRYENDQLEEHHGEWIMHEYSLHQGYLAYQGVDPNYVLCRIRKNERAKRKLETRGELQQPNKKRIMAPKISHNERPKTKAKKRSFVDQLQPTEQRVMTFETTCNLDLMPDMTTHQDTSVVDHMSNMATSQDNVDVFDKPLMFTNENASFGIEDIPYVESASFGIEDVPYVESASFGIEDVPYVESTSFGIEDVPYVESASFGIEDVPYVESASFGIEDVPYVESASFGIEDIPCVERASFGIEDIPCVESASFSIEGIPYVSTDSAGFSIEDIPYVSTDDEWVDSLNFGDFKEDDCPFYSEGNFDETSCNYKI